MASTQNDEIDEIQRQMREIRINLGDEVHGLVNKARAMTDWRVHWRKHPWIWGSAAAALGYLIVPSRRFGDSDARTLADIARPPAPTSPRIRRVAGSFPNWRVWHWESLRKRPCKSWGGASRASCRGLKSPLRRPRTRTRCPN